MDNKLYNKNRKILKENIFYVLAIIIVILSLIPLPFYINAPGGIIDLDKKVNIENENKSKGSFNMSYVSEYKANIFTLLYAYLNPNFDIYSKKDYMASNDTYKTLSIREDLELDNSVDNAIILAYTKANEKIDILDTKIYVTYIYEEANTTLVVGDQITSINGIKVSTRDDILNILSALNVGDNLDIKVLNKNKIYHRKASIISIDDKKMIGIYTTSSTDYNVDRKIDVKFKNNESGPSGGLMLSLEIYNSLIGDDLTKGYKIAGTGTIDTSGNVGSIDGVKYKLKGAVKKHASIFFVPEGDNYDEAIKEKNEHNYKIEIVSVSTFDDALNYLKNL